MNKKILISIVILIFSIGCDRADTEKLTSSPGKLVKTLKLQGDVQQKQLVYPGKIVANKKVEMTFQVSGQLIELPVNKGQIVEKNQLLAKLDPQDFESNVKQANASFINAKGQFERAKQLIPQGFISKSDYDKLESEYESAQAQLELANKALKDSALTAPFDGIVADKFVENFENIQEKQLILSLQDISNIDIEIYLPEQDLIHAPKDEDKRTLPGSYVTLDAIPSRQFEVTLREVSTDADPVTNTYQVTLTMPAPSDLTVLPGMSASFYLNLPQAKTKKSLRLPVEAVNTNAQGNDFVWVVDESTMTVKQQVVTVGEMMGSSIQILSGLDGNERIVTAGTTLLSKDMKVRLWSDERNKAE